MRLWQFIALWNLVISYGSENVWFSLVSMTLAIASFWFAFRSGEFE
jgi:hypothetical protein